MYDRDLTVTCFEAHKGVALLGLEVDRNKSLLFTIAESTSPSAKESKGLITTLKVWRLEQDSIPTCMSQFELAAASESIQLSNKFKIHTLVKLNITCANTQSIDFLGVGFAIRPTPDDDFTDGMYHIIFGDVTTQERSRKHSVAHDKGIAITGLHLYVDSPGRVNLFVTTLWKLNIYGVGVSDRGLVRVTVASESSP